MRLSVFIFLSVGAAFAVGLVSGLNGVGTWSSFGRAILVLILLQVAYFLFLFFSANAVKRAKMSEETKRN